MKYFYGPWKKFVLLFFYIAFCYNCFLFFVNIFLNANEVKEMDDFSEDLCIEFEIH